MEDIIFKLNNVSFGYNNDLILENINLEIKTKDYIGLVGLNGSGKSTLLKLLLSINKPTSGSIYKKEKLKIGYVNQTTMTEEGSFPATVFEVVCFGLKKRPFSIITKEEKDKVNKILDLFSLTKFKNKSLSSLSGGQAQKVKIAKVLLSNPDLIILDEPTTGIDEESKIILNEMINHINEMKKTIILVSHEPNDLKDCKIIYKIIDKNIVLQSEVRQDA